MHGAEWVADAAACDVLAVCAVDRYVSDGDVVGLGTGRAAEAFIRVLAARVATGLRIRAVPTSVTSAALANALGIELVRLNDVKWVDVAVDGADEVDPALDLIKGGGGALAREKIVAAAARRFVVLVGAEKLVPVLGTRGELPVEVLPFGLRFCARRLRGLGLHPVPRRHGKRLFTTDNGNHLLDCGVAPLAHPEELEQRMRAIPGVVATGLLLQMADTVLIQEGETVTTRHRAETQACSSE